MLDKKADRCKQTTYSDNKTHRIDLFLSEPSLPSIDHDHIEVDQLPQIYIRK